MLLERLGSLHFPRKLEYDTDDSIDGDGNNRKSVSAQGSGSGKSGEFDLFNLNEPKKDWDEHPEMPKMMELGTWPQEDRDDGLLIPEGRDGRDHHEASSQGS